MPLHHWRAEANHLITFKWRQFTVRGFDVRFFIDTVKNLFLYITMYH